MKKIRVYELAKEVGMENKELFAKLIEWGYAVKAVSSTLDEGAAIEVRRKFSSSTAPGASVEEASTAVETTTVAEGIDDQTGSRTEVREKRIQNKGKTTIIRRRKKVLEAAPEAVEEIAVDPVAEFSEEAVVEHETPAETPDTPPEAELQPEVESTPEVEEQDDQAPTAQQPVSEVVDEAQEVKAEEPEPEAAPVVEEALVSEETKETKEAEETKEPVTTEPQKPAADNPVKASGDQIKTIVPDKRRQGLARVIKRSAIHIPVEEEKKKRPAPKKVVRPKPGKPARPGKPGKPARPGDAGGVAATTAGKDNDGRSDDRGGKKGKRFVKFHHEPAAKGKKGVKRKGFADVDMEDVAMAGGRLSTALRVGRGQRSGSKKQKQGGGGLQAAETRAIKKRIKIYETITIADLGHRMGVKASEVIAKLMGLGVMATLNQALDVDTATLVCTDFGYEVEQAVTEEISIINLEDQEQGGAEVARPPVVTVMGHVDHGKTSILDAIRNTDVAAGEAGGITQHIGAHYVRSSQGDVVFLDTPGHAAFTEMRSRGAKVTDVVVLVVAADDGVMDQTKEAINHAKAAEVPIVVAVNKIDKEGADPMRVKRELAEFDLVPEEWGGDTIYCETSAKQNIGIDELLEQILLQAEIQELKADAQRKPRGWVIEAHLHKGRGPVATILIQQGTLKVGESFVVGEHYGKVRSLLNDKGRNIKDAGPSMPVEVQGLSGVPRAGDEFIVVSDDKMAKSVSSERQMKSRENQLAQTSKISLDNLFDKLKEGDVKELKVLLRADVQGTLEAFGKSIEKLSTDEIRVKMILEGTGAIIDSDILLASASDAIIIGFNVRPSTKVQEFASNENVEIRYYDVIYHALDDIKKAMTGLLDPTFVERVLGSLEVRETFSVPKIGTIAGCSVTDGKIERSAQLRLIRDSIVIFTGKLSSLRRFKDDVKEVASGYECGVGIENYNDIKVGDVIEAFVMDEVAGVL